MDQRNDQAWACKGESLGGSICQKMLVGSREFGGERQSRLGGFSGSPDNGCVARVNCRSSCGQSAIAVVQ